RRLELLVLDLGDFFGGQPVNRRREETLGDERRDDSRADDSAEENAELRAVDDTGVEPKERRDGPGGETGAHETRCPRRSKPRRSHRPRRAWRLSADSTALDVDGDLLLSSVGTTRGRSVQAARPLPDAPHDHSPTPVRKEGLEPSRFYPQEPESCA